MRTEIKSRTELGQMTKAEIVKYIYTELWVELTALEIDQDILSHMRRECEKWRSRAVKAEGEREHWREEAFENLAMANS